MDRNSKLLILPVLFVALAGAGVAHATHLADAGELYASSGFGGTDPGSLFTINAVTGAATLVGSICGAEICCTAVPGLAIQNGGQIYGVCRTGAPGGGPGVLVRIDADDAEPHRVHPSNNMGADAEWIDFDGPILYGNNALSGTLYTFDHNVSGAVTSTLGSSGHVNANGGAFEPCSATAQLYTAHSGNTQGTGTPGTIYLTDKANGSSVGLPMGAGLAVSGLTIIGPTLYGLQAATAGSGSGNPAGVPDFNLVDIDEGTGSRVVIGPTGFKSMAGLASWSDCPGVPVTGFAMNMLLLALLMTAVMVVAVWRSRMSAEGTIND